MHQLKFQRVSLFKLSKGIYFPWLNRTLNRLSIFFCKVIYFEVRFQDRGGLSSHEYRTNQKPYYLILNVYNKSVGTGCYLLFSYRLINCQEFYFMIEFFYQNDFYIELTPYIFLHFLQL